MRYIETIHAQGHVLCHDITVIVKDVKKGVAFKKGHVVTEEDIPELLKLGKDHLYVWEKDDTCYHEDEAAEILRDVCMGQNMRPPHAPGGENRAHRHLRRTADHRQRPPGGGQRH